jgi:hypothetical protein
MIKRFLFLTFFGLFSVLGAEDNDVAMGDTVYVNSGFVSLSLTSLAQAHQYVASHNFEAVQAMVRSGDLILIDKSMPGQLIKTEVIPGWARTNGDQSSVALLSVHVGGRDALLWVEIDALSNRPKTK